MINTAARNGGSQSGTTLPLSRISCAVEAASACGKRERRVLIDERGEVREEARLPPQECE
jgi:hypothetical protein